MQFKIQIVVDEENGETITEELFALDKSYDGDGLVGLGCVANFDPRELTVIVRHSYPLKASV